MPHLCGGVKVTPDLGEESVKSYVKCTPQPPVPFLKENIGQNFIFTIGFFYSDGATIIWGTVLFFPFVGHLSDFEFHRVPEECI